MKHEIPFWHVYVLPRNQKNFSYLLSPHFTHTQKHQTFVQPKSRCLITISIFCHIENSFLMETNAYSLNHFHLELAHIAETYLQNIIHA